LDDPVPEEVLEEIRKLPEILFVKQVVI
jgi:hypothetical protein